MSDQESGSQLTGAFDLFKKSKDLVMKNFKFFAVLYFLPFLGALFGTLSWFSSPSRPASSNTELQGLSEETANQIADNLGAIVAIVLGVVVIAILIASLYQAMLHRLELDSASNSQPSFASLWSAAKKYWWRLLGLSVVVGFYIFSGFFILIPIILLSTAGDGSSAMTVLAIPALVFAVYVLVKMVRRYFLAPYVLIDQDVKVMEAMKRSDALTKGRAGSVWGIIGVMILLSLTNIVPFVGELLSFFLVTLYSVAPALRYYELKKLAPASAA